jgi:hypothetical protein
VTTVTVKSFLDLDQARADNGSNGSGIVMTRHALFVAAFLGLLFSANAWALPQSYSCRLGARAPSRTVLGVPMCVLLHDPWQDCDEDPWQLTSWRGAPDAFLDPWQDSADPWQPFAAPARHSLVIDPWQPVVVQRGRHLKLVAGPTCFDDPWQPVFVAPWQEGAADPWQLP